MDSVQVQHVTELSSALAKYGPSAAAVFLVIIVLYTIIAHSKTLMKSAKVFWLYVGVVVCSVVFLGISVYDFFTSKKDYYSITMKISSLPANAYLGDRDGVVYSSIKYDIQNGNNANLLYRTSYQPNCMRINYGRLGHHANVYEINLEEGLFHPKERYLDAFFTTEGQQEVLKLLRFRRAANQGLYKVVRPFVINSDPDPTQDNRCRYETRAGLDTSAVKLATMMGNWLVGLVYAAQAPPTPAEKQEVLRALQSHSQPIVDSAAEILSKQFESYAPLINRYLLQGGGPNVLAASLSAASDQKPIVRRGSFDDHTSLASGMLDKVIGYLTHDDAKVRFQATRFMRRYPGDAVAQKLEARYSQLKQAVVGNGASRADLNTMSLAMMDWYYNRAAAIWKAREQGWPAPPCSEADTAFERSFAFSADNSRRPDKVYFAKPLYGRAVFAQDIADGKLAGKGCPAFNTANVRQKFQRFVDYVKRYGPENYSYQSHIELAAKALGIDVDNIYSLEAQPQPQAEVQLLTGIDFPGNDYNRINRVDLDACKEACVKDSQCKAFTYDNRRAPNGVCWLKRAVSPRTNVSFAISGIVR